MSEKEYERFVSVACANFQTKWGDKEANLEKIEAITREAAKGGSHIIVFPELALSGYECDESVRGSEKPCFMHRDLAETVPGPFTDRIAEVARDLGVYVIFGMPERDEDNASLIYNSSAILGPKGVLGTYRKLHLAPSPNFTEEICFTSGKKVPVWETDYGPIGVLICYDFWYFPELARIIALRGARLIINITASAAGPGKAHFIVQQTGSRATENIVYTASANLVGKDKTKNYAGHSVIAGPLGTRPIHIFVEAGESEEVISATLDFKKLSIRYESMPWKRSRHSDLINEEFSRLLHKDHRP